MDVGPIMDVAPPTGDQDTPLETSLRIAGQIVAQKVGTSAQLNHSAVMIYLYLSKARPHVPAHRSSGSTF